MIDAKMPRLIQKNRRSNVDIEFFVDEWNCISKNERNRLAEKLIFVTIFFFRFRMIVRLLFIFSFKNSRTSFGSKLYNRFSIFRFWSIRRVFASIIVQREQYNDVYSIIINWQIKIFHFLIQFRCHWNKSKKKQSTVDLSRMMAVRCILLS